MFDDFQKKIKDHGNNVGLDLQFDEQANQKAINAFIDANKDQIMGKLAADKMANKLWDKRLSNRKA